ncbi:MAG: phenylacetate--CoA ligase family protein [Pirellulaceae bacterium]
MNTIETLYNRSPIAVQSALINAWGMAWYMRRCGKWFAAKITQLRANERLTHSEFRSLQLESLNRILEHAASSPYYADLFSRSLMSRPLRSLDQLSEFPTLSKQFLRSNPKSLLTSKPERGTIILNSSGTTGTPTDVYYTKRFHQEGAAYFQARLRDWAGVSSRDKRAMFGVRRVCPREQNHPPFWRHSFIENLAYFSIYHISPANLPHYARHLREWQPKLVMGYPSALNLIAKFMIESDQRMQAKALITTSETVTSDARKTLEQAFGCKLFDQYGAVENTHFVSQCEYGRYHVSPERGIIEILEGDSPCPPGKPGRVVVTGLENTLQPLIRYEIGDAAYWAEDQCCPCGRQMPIIGGVEGRYEDYCETPDGRRFLVFDPVFNGIKTIKEGQVIQESPDRFLVKVVATDDFREEDRQLMIANFRRLVGELCVRVEVVKSIARTSNGKFRAVVNQMKSQPAMPKKDTCPR